MGLQKFYASSHTEEFSNGAIGHCIGGPMDCLGPFAKVHKCPIRNTKLTRTCYASDYADTFFSVPARCKVGGKTITGFFTVEENAIMFHPHSVFAEYLRQWEEKRSKFYEQA